MTVFQATFGSPQPPRVNHPDGIVAGYTNSSVRFLGWDELDMAPPDDPDNPEEFLGDEASNDELRKMLGN